MPYELLEALAEAREAVLRAVDEDSFALADEHLTLVRMIAAAMGY